MVQVWLGTRLLLVAVAVWVSISTGRSASDLLANWDVQHFFAIASQGYVAENDIAFFPGWPMLLHVFGVVGVPPLAAGVGLAVLFSALAAAALYRLGGTTAAVAWLLVPTTVFTLVPYTESAFCAAAFWAWERARAGRWGAASGLAALACLVRVSGVFLVVALLVLALTDPGEPRRPTPRSDGDAGRPAWRRAAWLAVPALTSAGYFGYLYLLTGRWDAWYHAQTQGWARGFTWPWDSYWNTLGAATSTDFPAFPEWAVVFRMEIASMVLGLAVTLVCLVQRRWAEATWVGLQVAAFSLSYWFFSVNRAVLLWFPLFLLIGRLADSSVVRRRPWGLRVLVALVVVCLALWGIVSWAWLFYTGRWAS